MSTAVEAGREQAARGAEGVPGQSRPAGAPDLDLEILQEFVLEANEQLTDADSRLLELEKSPHQNEALNALARPVTLGAGELPPLLEAAQPAH